MLLMKLFVVDGDAVVDQLKNVMENMDTMVYQVYDYLSFSPDRVFGFSDMTESLIQISQTIALVLVVAYWLIGFINEITDMDWRNLSIWWYFRKIIQLILAKALIDLAPDICSSIMSFINWAMETYWSNSTFDNALNQWDYKLVKELFTDVSYTEYIFKRIEITILCLVMKCCIYYLKFVAFSRLIQIAIMQIISPISLSSIVNGRQSGAFNFIKEYVAVVGSAIIILIGFKVYQGYLSSIFFDSNNVFGLNIVWEMLLSTVVLATTIGASQKIARMFLGR